MLRQLNLTHPVCLAHPIPLASEGSAIPLVILLQQQDQWLPMWPSVSNYTVVKIVLLLQRKEQNPNHFENPCHSIAGPVTLSLIQSITHSFLLLIKKFNSLQYNI